MRLHVAPIGNTSCYYIIKNYNSLSFEKMFIKINGLYIVYIVSDISFMYRVAFT